jgi:hypothetical protein
MSQYSGDALKYKDTQGAKDILDMIGKAETGKIGEDAYNAWNGGMPKEWIGQNLSNKTLAEIMKMQESNPTKGTEAAGKYQFMPNTLKELATGFKLDTSKKFSADMQDELALMRIHQMRGSSLNKLLEGSIGTDEFNKAILPEWAGVPATTKQVYDKNGGKQNVVETGQSYYDGTFYKGSREAALNKATITAEIARVSQEGAWGSANKPSTALIPGNTTTGQQVQENSDTLLGGLHEMFKQLNDAFKTQYPPTIINNNTSHSSSISTEPAGVHSSDYAGQAIRNFALYGNGSYIAS